MSKQGSKHAGSSSNNPYSGLSSNSSNRLDNSQNTTSNRLSSNIGNASNTVNNNQSNISNSGSKSSSNSAPATKIELGLNSLQPHSNTTSSVQPDMQKVWKDVRPMSNEKPISRVYSAIDNDLARDNLENDITYADLQDL
ncbi:MAG: hypothetical protein IJ424_07705 [Oscillospiraceae bacterium]|nr:hypothetical protein [Oscillospiraceae bacterium]